MFPNISSSFPLPIPDPARTSPAGSRRFVFAGGLSPSPQAARIYRRRCAEIAWHLSSFTKAECEPAACFLYVAWSWTSGKEGTEPAAGLEGAWKWAVSHPCQSSAWAGWFRSSTLTGSCHSALHCLAH